MIRYKGIIFATIALLLAVEPGYARRKTKDFVSAATFGVRQHVNHPTYPQLPFADGDTSYLFAYEYHENEAFWQMGVEYTPTGSATGDVFEAEGIYTPQVHLIFQNQLFWGGAGLMKSYITKPEKGWTGFYWQMQIGIHLPISSSIDIRASGYYVFDDWSDVSDFDMDEVEIGFSVAYVF